MISSIFLSGRLGESIGEDGRYVEVDRVIPGPGGSYVTDAFPVFTPLRNGPLLKAAKGSLVILKGRVEIDKEKGFVIIDEIDEVFALPKGMRNI